LPLKYQPNGSVLSVDNKTNSFRHQLDTFSVNSGSAVFKALTKEIVSIHVRGTGLNYRQDKEMKCNRWGKREPSKDWGEANFIDLAF
jgi:V8-like Glu-specific endopeptidase